MEEITKLLIAFGNIQITTKTLWLAIIIVIGILLYKIFDDHKFKKYYNDMKNEKNKEIERLADDNRRYRDIYLRGLGVKQDEVDVMSAANMKEG